MIEVSFVSIVADPNWATIVSDSYLIDETAEGSFKVIPGRKPSYMRLSASQLIACTGSARLLRQLKSDYLFQQRAWKIDARMLNEMRLKVAAISPERQDVLAAIVEAGERMSCRMISNEAGAVWQTLEPDNHRLATLFMASRAIDPEQIAGLAAKLDRRLKMIGKSQEEVLRAQKETLLDAAKIDTTVSQQSFHLVVSRPTY